MCGIAFVLGDESAAEALAADVAPLLQRRGPDVSGRHSIDLGGGRVLLAIGSVLHLRGSHPQAQPIRASGSNSWLLWNGEIYDGLSMSDTDNDGARLFERLSECPSEMLATLSAIKGEWALAFYDAPRSRLVFGRDFFGRRSLVQLVEADTLAIASVIPTNAHGWSEVPAGSCLFEVDVSLPSVRIIEHPWQPPAYICVNSESKDALVAPVGRLNACLAVPSDDEVESASVALASVLKAAVGRRVSTAPAPLDTPDAARVAILFSGGLDCAVISAFADAFVPPSEPIDLLNVVFENHRASSTSIFDAPDRRTALSTHAELCAVFPHRRWRLILENIPRAELDAHASHILSLAAPHGSVLDYSLAASIWFAARGVGVDAQSGAPASTSARVLLLGMGADEQLGGYSRARSRFDSGGWAALQAELQMDVDRIASRNLGRDDRIVGDHGREARFPFLDEDVVKYLGSLPVAVKTDPAAGREHGDKRLLRRVARELGLKGAAAQPKRAIQFGSRIANPAQKGSDAV